MRELFLIVFRRVEASPGLIASSQAIVAEGMEALRQDRVLSFHLRSTCLG